MVDTNSQVNLVGGRLITAFSHMVSAVRIHQDNNTLVKDCAAHLAGVLSEISEGQRVVIGVWRGRFHIQGEKLPYQRETFTLINEMLVFFSQRDIGEVTFCNFPSEGFSEELVVFVRLLNDSVKHEYPRTWLEVQLGGQRIMWVAVSGTREEGEDNFDAQRREKARKTYFHSLNTVKEVAEKVTKGVAGLRKARRLAQMIVDLIQVDNSLLLGLATIRDYDDCTYTHSVNVAVLATCLGKHIGLSRVLLEYLTVCGLFHDLGKVGVSKDILLKQGELSDAEWDVMRRHPLIGVRKILRLKAPHSLRSRIILGPFEHHLNPDLTGYPKTHFMKKLSLLGRILRIADVYEALTSERSYRPRAFTPDEALRRMWSERGKSFDPILLKCFINMMGTYPVGSLVELDTGELGLVMEYPEESLKDRPLLMLLKDDGAGGLTPGSMVNLALEGMSSTLLNKRIVRGLHPSRFGIQPSQFFLQDPGASWESGGEDGF